MKLKIKNAKVYDGTFQTSEIVDILVEQGVIRQIKPNITCEVEKELDAGGGLVCRAFCDYHLHVPGSWLYDLFGANLSPLSTLEEYRDILSGCIKRYDIVRGFGWGLDTLTSMFSTRKDTPIQFLDSISSDKPIVIFSNDFHSCWCNTKALESIGVQYEGYRDERIIKSGILHAGIAQKVFNMDLFSFTDAEIRTAIKSFQNQLIGYGVCEVVSFMFIGASKKKLLDVLFDMDKEGLLSVRFNLCLDAFPQMGSEKLLSDYKLYKNYETDNIKFNTVKVYADGVVDNHTAALFENYSDTDTNCSLLWKKEDLISICKKSNELGLSVHAHAIGDAAVSFVLDCFEECKKYKVSNSITHIQLCKQEDIQRMKSLETIACLQPFWFLRGDSAENVDRIRLGNRVDNQYRCNSFLALGVSVVFSSDSPVTSNFDPLLGMSQAILDDGSQESIEITDAYIAYQCKNSGTNKNKASLSIGDEANIIILSDDIFTKGISPSTHVQYTIIKDRFFELAANN